MGKPRLDGARVEIGAKIIARYIVQPFGADDMFGGNLFRLVQPFGNRALRNAKVIGHFLLATAPRDSEFQSFISGYVCRHSLQIFPKEYYVNPKSIKYSFGDRVGSFDAQK
jgi:hypothetical protein